MLAFITPVLTHYPDTPETPEPDCFCRFGNLVDLVAWDSRTPRQWRLRAGLATWLGCVRPQYLDPGRVRVWRSVSTGFAPTVPEIVLLSRDPAVAYSLLMGIPRRHRCRGRGACRGDPSVSSGDPGRCRVSLSGRRWRAGRPVPRNEPPAFADHDPSERLASLIRRQVMRMIRGKTMRPRPRVPVGKASPAAMGAASASLRRTGWVGL